MAAASLGVAFPEAAAEGEGSQGLKTQEQRPQETGAGEVGRRHSRSGGSTVL